jgi:hypothetical protein
MANTFELIASSTVGSGGAASIDFTSIPSTFTDLCVKLSLRTNNASNIDNIVYQYNNDTTSGRYSYRFLGGQGSSAFSDLATGAFNYLGTTTAATTTANTFANSEIYIPNYSGSSQKSSSVDSVMENNATLSYQNLIANLYNQTTAISSIKIYSVTSSNFVQHSTAYLYGVKNA